MHWGNRRPGRGEPPARPTLTDLSSGLLEPQGKPGWGIIENIIEIIIEIIIEFTIEIMIDIITETIIEIII